MQEAGHPVIVALRLKIEGQKISEIETIVARSGMAEGGAASLEKLGKPRAGFLEEIPPAERVSRLEMIKTANKYFSGMESNDGKGDYSFFGDDCNRLENGMQTTNNMTPMSGLTSNGQPRPAPSAKYDPATNPTAIRRTGLAAINSVPVCCISFRGSATAATRSSIRNTGSC